MRSTAGSCAAARITASMCRRPDFRIDVEPVGAHHHRSPTSPRARSRDSSPVRHRRQPDVGVEADLMAGVAGQHRAAARLRHVADQQAGQPAPCGALAASRSSSATRSGWPQLRLRDSRITCQVSPLIGSAFAAGDAALGIEADRARRQLPPASACGRTIPWRRAWDRSDWRAAAAAWDRRCPCPAPAPGGSCDGSDISRRVENQARVHRITLSAKTSTEFMARAKSRPAGSPAPRFYEFPCAAD